MALVGILTAIDGIEGSITRNFSTMGASSFSIQNRSSGVFFGGGGRRKVDYAPISFKEATRFKDAYTFSDQISVNCNVSFNAVAKFANIQTNPNCVVTGGDEAYLDVSGYSLKSGRNFNRIDVQKQYQVVIIGQEVKQKLFGQFEAVGEFIRIKGVKFRVIGVLEEKSAAFDFGGNRILLIPVTTARKWLSNETSFNIGVALSRVDALQQGIQEATILFRNIRRLQIRDPDNFEMVSSDSISAKLIENLYYVSFAAALIAVITLAGAAVGLMNIMLVSVTERTREIGIRKALGARSTGIMWQFLTEALLICQMGGITGILLGILIGNLVSIQIGGSFMIPWAWMLLSVLVCIVVGVLSGFIPARKAALVDPIVALRHE